MTTVNKYFILVISLVLSSTTFGQIRLPKLIGNGMVLQRDAKIKVWGWAAPEEKITIDFINKKYNIMESRK